MDARHDAELDRRSFLRHGAGLAAGLALAGGLAQLSATGAHATRRHGRGDYGPLAPVADHSTGLPLLLLPRGFEYLSYGWTGDVMDDGIATPSSHDGMGAFRSGDLVRLVRNHEQTSLSGAFASGMTYDPMASGGTTTLRFDPHAGRFLGSRASLSGTIRNCAGGPTPWGSWLSCEETTMVNGSTRHGYVFEVPADGRSNGAPLTGLGRFRHEAAAVDPATDVVYLTEDSNPAGLYRFVPRRRGDLAAGGTLQMLVIGASSVVTAAHTGPTDYGVVSWTTIGTPDPAPDEPSTVEQGIAGAGAQFERLEGIWADEGTVWFVSTTGGPGNGQIFQLDLATHRLRLIFHSPSDLVLDSPDNLCRSPRGGMVLCEDGTGPELLRGFTPEGDVFPFAQNNVVLDGTRGFVGDFTDAEWSGATFEPRNGHWLFANLHSPGITFAITGPWHQGAL